MIPFGTTLEDHERKRLCGMLVTMDQEHSVDGDELCERLLDLPNSEMNGKALRWAVDNRTWYGLADNVNAAEFFSVVTRLLDGKGSHTSLMPLVKVAKLIMARGRSEVGMEYLRVDSFEYGGARGCYALLWELKPLEYSHSVTCRGCGVDYDFLSGAGIVTVEDVKESFHRASWLVIEHSSRVAHPDPDMFALNAEERGVPQYVLEWLRAGKYRRWCCQKCHRRQGYPGSLFMAPDESRLIRQSPQQRANGPEQGKRVSDDLDERQKATAAAQEFVSSELGQSMGATLSTDTSGFPIVECLGHTVPNAWIETLNLTGVERILARVRDELREQGQFRLCPLRYDGYGDDPRAVFEIPEVRRWCAYAFDKNPCLPALLSEDTLTPFILCILDDVEITCQKGDTTAFTYSERTMLQLILRVGRAALEFFGDCGVLQPLELATEHYKRLISTLLPGVKTELSTPPAEPEG